MKILITAPLRQDPKIFDEFQRSLDELVIPEGFTADRFFVVNDCPEVIPHIRRARYITHDTGDEYRKTDKTHIWTGDNLWKMSDLRNMTIQFMLRYGYDYWLSADTDLVLNRHTLEYLLAANKDIVSEVFWTEAEAGGIWCNAWMYDDGDVDHQLTKWREPGLYRVGMTGALMLVKRRVFEAGVGYARIPNIRNALIGEDRWFCVRAACAGFDLWMDTHVPATHLYTEKVYQEYMKRREQEHAERVQAGAEDHDRSV